MEDIEQQEQRRLALQAHLDSEKTQAERNRLGQFATPTALALDILYYAKTILPKQATVRFLDPAIGTGSFYSAFLRVFGSRSVYPAVGYEIDEHYGTPARKLWSGYDLDIRAGDFTKASPPVQEVDKATLVVCNPPYVRHHHLSGDEKKRLNASASLRQGVSLSGLSGLYCYFLCLSIDWMAQGGLAAWLVPSEFMDVNYGKVLKEFLLKKVTLLHVHRFSPEDVQFGDALVSSAVVLFKNEIPAKGHRAKFSFGGSLLKPSTEKKYSLEYLERENKWTSLHKTGLRRSNGKARFTIADFFEVKRGIATGANGFFILSPSDVERRGIPLKFLIPILPSPRHLKTDLIESGIKGVPKIEKHGFLFSSEMSETSIQNQYPKVWRYLEEGGQQGIPQRYICRNRRPWYSQEKREIPPFLCTYMGRANGNGGTRPFRFIFNCSGAIATNVYLMLYPKPWIKRAIQEDPQLAEKVWHVLQSIPVESLIGEGRVYGGGLHKIEPKELLNAPADMLVDVVPGNAGLRERQMSLL